eukprot:3419510-Karenia_brevis.AAC.1
MPITWRKVGGGFSYEWVGYWQDLQRFEVGISEARAQWLVRWMSDACSDNVVLVRQFVEGLGRLSFTMGAKKCVSADS